MPAFAHLDVIDILERNGNRFHLVVGISTISVVGVLDVSGMNWLALMWWRCALR